MANVIQFAKRYVPLLDEVYKASAKSGILDSSDMVRAGANVNEIVIPKIDMDGLADYDRNTGYTPGDVSLTWETVTFNYERGRMFTVDNMDNEESVNLAFGRLAGEFVRTKAAPELDAFRFAYLASETGINTVEANLTKGEQVIGALRDVANTMDEKEVPEDSRILFITPTLRGMIDDMDTYKSQKVTARFSQMITVPQSRFYTKVKLNDGTAADEEAGGYVKAADAKDINFLAVRKEAIIQYTKHLAPKIITPAENQDADAWKFGYRIYGIIRTYENKRDAIFCSHASA